MNNQLILASLLLLNVVLCWGGNDSKDRVLLSSINTLTFYNSRYTTGRRSRYELLRLFILDLLLK